MDSIGLQQAERDHANPAALIAEARARARRRRIKTAVVLIVIAAIGAAAGLALTSHHAAARTPARHPASFAARTGTVIGHLSACFGLAPVNGQQPITPGTVVAVPGHLTTKPNGPGSWRLVFPKGPAVGGSQRITNNYDQTFRFALPPGHYVLEGRYDGSRTAIPGAFAQVTVVAAKTIHINVMSACA